MNIPNDSPLTRRLLVLQTLNQPPGPLEIAMSRAADISTRTAEEILSDIMDDAPPPPAWFDRAEYSNVVPMLGARRAGL